MRRLIYHYCTSSLSLDILFRNISGIIIRISNGIYEDSYLKNVLSPSLPIKILIRLICNRDISNWQWGKQDYKMVDEFRGCSDPWSRHWKVSALQNGSQGATHKLQSNPGNDVLKGVNYYAPIQIHPTYAFVSVKRRTILTFCSGLYNCLGFLDFAESKCLVKVNNYISNVRV